MAVVYFKLLFGMYLKAMRKWQITTPLTAQLKPYFAWSLD